MTEVSIRQGAFWNAADVLVRQGGQFAIAIVLARLVSPEEFGLVALLALFLALSTAFVDTGLSSALVQRQKITREDESTVFWFNMAAGTLAALLFAASAPLIAGFYGEPRLVALTWAMSFNVWLSAWVGVPNALMMKKFDFRTRTKASVAGISAGAIVAITLGLQGAGVWALAAQLLVTSAVTAVATWTLTGWRPTLVFRLESFRNLFGFGVFMFLSSLLDLLATRVYTVLIGKLYSPTELGFYARGAQTRDFAQMAMSTLLGRIAFPLFSSVAHDKAELRRQMVRALRLAMALNIPLMLGMSVVAPDAVIVLFGERWFPAGPVLQVLALAAVILPMHTVNLNALMAGGHSHLFLRLEVIKKVQLICVVVAVSPFGVMAIAWGTVFCAMSGFLINCWYTRRFLDYGPLAQIRDVFPYLASGAAMAVAVYCAGLALGDFAPALRLAAQVAAGAAVYFCLLWLFRLEAFTIGRDLLRSAFPLRAKGVVL